jgi:hypothetical protein
VSTAHVYSLQWPRELASWNQIVMLLVPARYEPWVLVRMHMGLIRAVIVENPVESGKGEQSR